MPDVCDGAKVRRLLALWLLLPIPALAQEATPTAQAEPRPGVESRYDVVLKSRGRPTRAGKADDALGRGAMLLVAFKTARPGDVVELGPGLFDVGDVGSVFLPRGVTIRGQGMTKTRVRNTLGKRVAQGCAFEAAGGVALEDLWLDADHPPTSDQVTFGFNSEKSPSNATAVARRCKFTGHDFVLYIWAGTGNRIVAEDCEIHGGRFLVFAGISGKGIDGCYFNLRRCRLYGDAALSASNSGEEVGFRMAAFGCRGGTITDTGSQVWMKGSPQIGYVRGAWIDAAPYGVARIVLRGTRMHLDGNGAKEVWDIDTLGAKAPDVHRFRGTGSGPGGRWLVRGPVQVGR